MDRLPAELHDQIIEELDQCSEDSYKDLFSMCLTCQCWNSLTRPTLERWLTEIALQRIAPPPWPTSGLTFTGQISSPPSQEPLEELRQLITYIRSIAGDYPTFGQQHFYLSSPFTRQQGIPPSFRTWAFRRTAPQCRYQFATVQAPADYHYKNAYSNNFSLIHLQQEGWQNFVEGLSHKDGRTPNELWDEPAIGVCLDLREVAGPLDIRLRYNATEKLITVSTAEIEARMGDDCIRSSWE